MAAAWPVRELWPLPRFCQPISNEQGIETKLLSSGWHPLTSACALSLFKESWQLVFAMHSTALPTSRSLCLYVHKFRGGMSIVASTLLMWVWPIPACRQLSATLVFTLKAGGPRFPDLCSPEVFILLLFPQNKHFMKNILAKPCRVSFVTLWNDSGPI